MQALTLARANWNRLELALPFSQASLESYAWATTALRWGSTESSDRVEAPATPAQKRRRTPFRWHDEWTQFRTLLRRSFISKLRNKANVIITLCVAPFLALLIATILRYSDSGHYDFASAYHIPTFLFLSLIVAMFLGLTNSADDIIR